MATHSPYFLNLIPPLSMGNPFPLPPSHSSATIPHFPHLRAATSSAPQQAQAYHPVPVQIHHPPHIQPPVPTFRAPAHKHAHHLHSIPPREKSTRTLIIDHMLWVHARTRFAQARAELGMTDRTGGPSSLNYTHRRRPENYDEEEEVLSEGEDLLFLKTRSGWPGPTHDDDDADHLSKQDLALARSLRLRAEGLETVISSMLDQPPPHHPTDNDDTTNAPTPSPKGFRTGSHPHTLPNGVRLRLALGTVINDLFARQAPPQPYRHTHLPKLHEEAHPHHPPHVIANLPETLMPLVPLSGAFILLDDAPYSSTPPQQYATASGYATHPVHFTHPHIHLHTPKYSHHLTPSPRVTSFYNSGADPSTANSPPSLRCPRHLHTGCEVCVEAKSTSRSNSNRPATHIQNKSSSSTASQRKSTSVDGIGGGLSGWQDGSGIGSGLLRPGIKGNALRRSVYDDDTSEKGGGTGAGNTKLSKLIPRFLRLSALVAAELGQEARDAEWGSSNRLVPVPPSPAMSRAVLPNPPRGKERDEESEYDNLLLNALRPTREWYLLLAGLLTRAVLEGYLTAGWRGTKPTECLLLVGIGINNRSAVSGRVRAANRVVGDEEAVGKGYIDGSDGEDEDSESFGHGEEFMEFNPDGLPSLDQAMRVLFPSLQEEPEVNSVSISGVGQPRKAQAEIEYKAEMLERLRRFYDIPESTPDLSTHMEDLAWSYPAEPVERAAIRFCEAVARWRGKPELETYKKKSPASPGMSIDSLVHSNPSSPSLATSTATPYSLASLESMLGQPPQPAFTTQAPSRPRRPACKPSIATYFSGISSQAGSKRGRDEQDMEGREEGVKRIHM